MTTTDLDVYDAPTTALIRPAADIADIEQAFREYQQLCDSLLDKSDYQTYMQWNPETRRKEPRAFRKRSAWRKLATAMGVTFQIVDRVKERDAAGRIVSAEFVVRATAPNGRYSDGWGNCDRYERCKDTCKDPCLEKHFTKPEHDIPATAETRAKNRAAADLFGMGEVSAEEMAGAERDQAIEDAEIIRDPDGNVFPDQRDLIEPQSPFQPPAGAEEKGRIGQPGYVTEPQHRNIRRLWKKLIDEFGATDEALRAGLLLEHETEHTSELTKAAASAVITRFKEQAGE